MSKSILIVGAGAVGAFYASRLATIRNINVSVICRSNYKAVKANGFKVTSPTYGDYTFTPHETFSSPEEARANSTRWDFILVCTKALPDVHDDSQILEGLISHGTAIALIQNGLGVEAAYAKRFPDVPLLSAVTIISAAQPENGVIKHNRWTRISIGPYFADGTSSEARTLAVKRNAELVQLLQQGGIKDAEEYTATKLQLLRWHKVAINASMNPSSVLSGLTPNSAMAHDSELYLHLKGVMDEVLQTAAKVTGQALPKEFASAEQILKSTQRNTSGSKPSMAIDWEAGKTMELEVILGQPIRIAREKGLEMPRLQSMYALLKMAQANRDKKAKDAKL